MKNSKTWVRFAIPGLGATVIADPIANIPEDYSLIQADKLEIKQQELPVGVRVNYLSGEYSAAAATSGTSAAYWLAKWRAFECNVNSSSLQLYEYFCESVFIKLKASYITYTIISGLKEWYVT